mgnify:CR=1 FL=1
MKAEISPFEMVQKESLVFQAGPSFPAGRVEAASLGPDQFAGIAPRFPVWNKNHLAP